MAPCSPEDFRKLIGAKEKEIAQCKKAAEDPNFEGQSYHATALRALEKERSNLRKEFVSGHPEEASRYGIALTDEEMLDEIDWSVKQSTITQATDENLKK